MRRKIWSEDQIRIVGDIAYVQLTSGHECVIDKEDVGIISGINWSASMTKHSVYARAYIKGRKVFLHRLLFQNDITPGTFVDHIDHDGLNNRRSNLRKCSHAENQRNKNVSAQNKLLVKGVRNAKNGRFSASICVNDKSIFLGVFDTITEASAAYRGAATVAYGEFAFWGRGLPVNLADEAVP